MGAKRTGVKIISETAFQISFVYKGKRYRPRVRGNTANPRNVKAAERFRRQVLDAIEDEKFDFATFFPKSKEAKECLLPPTKSILLKNYLPRWFEKEYKPYLKDSSKVKDERTLRNQIVPAFGKYPISILTWNHVLDWAKKKTCTTKTKNNIITILRSAMNDAVENHIIEVNPLENRSLSKSRVEKRKEKAIIQNRTENEREFIVAFSVTEFKDILAACDGQLNNAYKFHRWTGVRTSELCGLRWEDVSIKNEEVRIQRVITEESINPEHPKTKAGVRTITLLPEALQAIRLQKQHTYLQGGFVFQNPRNNQHWRPRAYRLQWMSVLKKADVIYRSPYQMRHTYATTHVMAGVSIGWISKQMGHESPSFTFDNYGKFMISDDMQNEGLKTAKMFATLG